MPILLKHVEPWPISIAGEDLRATVALYYYAKYGLDMRSALEVEGPYELAPLDVRYINAIGVVSRRPLREAQSYFKRHRKFVEQTASYQLLLSCYSVFEFLIANLVLFVYLGCKGRALAKGFTFVWAPNAQATFLGDKRIADIEQDGWMQRHHRDEEVRARTRLLDEVCHLQIRAFTAKAGSRTLGWEFFRRYRRLRHSVAHTSGRSSLYSKTALERRPITEAVLLDLHEYMSELLKHVNRRLYEIPIITFTHPAHGA